MLWQFLTLAGVFGFIAVVFLIRHSKNKGRQIIVKVDKQHKDYNKGETAYLFVSLLNKQLKIIEVPNELTAILVRKDYKKIRRADYFEKDDLTVLKGHGIKITFR